MNKIKWKKIVTCCYVVYLLSLIIFLPVMAVIYFFSEAMYKEAYYKTFKKYHQEFWRSKR